MLSFIFDKNVEKYFDTNYLLKKSFKNKRFEDANVLIENGVKINDKILCEAIISKSLEMIDKVIKYGAKLDDSDDGIESFSWALEYFNYDEFKFSIINKIITVKYFEKIYHHLSGKFRRVKLISPTLFTASLPGTYHLDEF